MNTKVLAVMLVAGMAAGGAADQLNLYLMSKIETDVSGVQSSTRAPEAAPEKSTEITRLALQ